MILGNKCDMTDKRIVNQDRGDAVSAVKQSHSLEIYLTYLFFPQIAREHGIRFIETSAKANVNIERAFRELAEAILDKTAGRESAENAERVQVSSRGQEKTPAYKGCCA